MPTGSEARRRLQGWWLLMIGACVGAVGAVGVGGASQYGIVHILAVSSSGVWFPTFRVGWVNRRKAKRDQGPG